MTAPYPPVVNYGTEEAPLFAGQTGAVGYARALHDVLKALRDFDTYADSPEAAVLDCASLVEKLYKAAAPPPPQVSP